MNNNEIVKFVYTNSLGYPKFIAIEKNINENNKHYFSIWDNVHGEFCGSGQMTKEEINDFLSHYHVKERFN